MITDKFPVFGCFSEKYPFALSRNLTGKETVSFDFSRMFQVRRSSNFSTNNLERDRKFYLKPRTFSTVYKLEKYIVPLGQRTCLLRLVFANISGDTFSQDKFRSKHRISNKLR